MNTYEPKIGADVTSLSPLLGGEIQQPVYEALVAQFGSEAVSSLYQLKAAPIGDLEAGAQPR